MEHVSFKTFIMFSDSQRQVRYAKSEMAKAPLLRCGTGLLVVVSWCTHSRPSHEVSNLGGSVDGGSWLRRVRNTSRLVLVPIVTFCSSVADTLVDSWDPHRSQVPHLRQCPRTSSLPQHVHVWSEFMSMSCVLLGEKDQRCPALRVPTETGKRSSESTLGWFEELGRGHCCSVVNCLVGRFRLILAPR